jgi:hypothetical protein
VTLGADADTEARFFNNPAAREHQIATVFRDLGQMPSAAERAAFLAMSPATFAMFLQTMRALSGQARTVRGEVERLAADTWRNRRSFNSEASQSTRTGSTTGLSASAIFAARRQSH